MERPSVKARIAGILTMLGRNKHHLKRKRVYILGIGMLLLLAFVAAGSSANAVGSTTQASANEAGQGSIQKDVLIVTGVRGHTINGKHKDGTTVTVITTASTIFKKDGASVGLDAVKAGEVIVVIGSSNAAGSFTATRVEINPLTSDGKGKRGDGGDAVFGSITAIHGATITVQYEGKTATVQTTSTTRFINKLERKEVTLASLKVGDFVYAQGKLDANGSLTAVYVVVGIPPDTSGSANNHGK